MLVTASFVHAVHAEGSGDPAKKFADFRTADATWPRRIDHISPVLEGVYVADSAQRSADEEATTSGRRSAGYGGGGNHQLSGKERPGSRR